MGLAGVARSSLTSRTRNCTECQVKVRCAGRHNSSRFFRRFAAIATRRIAAVLLVVL
jgi:hypothetical protein